MRDCVAVQDETLCFSKSQLTLLCLFFGVVQRRIKEYLDPAVCPDQPTHRTCTMARPVQPSLRTSLSARDSAIVFVCTNYPRTEINNTIVAKELRKMKAAMSAKRPWIEVILTSA